MAEESPPTSPNPTNLPSLYDEEKMLSKTELLTPKPIRNNPADCNHFFEIIEGAREMICRDCYYGGAFRLGIDLDELRDGKPHLGGKRMFFKRLV